MNESSENQALKAHSQMLGQIAAEVAEFCIDPHCTTLSAVRLMKAELRQLQAEKLQILADDQIQNSYAP